MKNYDSTNTYVLLFRHSADHPLPSPEEMQRNFERWSSWIDGLVSRGESSGGQRLDEAGTVVRNVGGVRIVDGPFVEGKEVVGGTLAVTASSLAAATEIAKGCPGLDHGFSVEVRPALCRAD